MTPFGYFVLGFVLGGSGGVLLMSLIVIARRNGRGCERCGS